VKIYRIIGNYKEGKNWVHISKEVTAKNKQEAEDYFYSLLGSIYRKKRREIRIEDAYSIPLKDATDPRAIHRYKKAGGENGE
jgi:Ribosomal protein L20A (L18A)